MQINRKPSDDVADAIRGGVAAIDVPPLNHAAIRARASDAAPEPAVNRSTPRWRPALVAVPAAFAVAIMIVAIPAVRAQVERAIRAFSIVDGRSVPLAVRAVTLDEARSQMPFAIIAPAGVPAGLRGSITELSSPSSPAEAHLVFQYQGSDGFPALTIDESSAATPPASGLMVTETRTSNGAPPDAPAVAPPPLPASARGHEAYVVRNVEVRRMNGRTTTHTLEIHPIVWVAHGTRIVLAPTSAAITARELAAIRAAMSR